MAEDKEKSLPKGRDQASLMASINKYFKSDIVRPASDAITASSPNVTKYSTGILSLDKYLGVGGLLGGRIMTCWGHEGTGKTLTALTVAAKFQQLDISTPYTNEKKARVAFLDAEATYSDTMARAVGADPDRILLSRSTPELIMTGERYFELINILVQQGYELIIVDSAPAMTPGNVINTQVGTGQKATHANMMSAGLQQVTTLLNAHQRSVVWFINQMRGRPMAMFGPPEAPTGGEALKFYATYSLEVRKVDDIVKMVPTNNGDYEKRIIGVSIKAKLHKNKTAAIPLDPIEFDVYFESTTDQDGIVYSAGVDTYKDVVEVGITSNVINQTSSWFTFGSIKANGKDAFIRELRLQGPQALDEIRKGVLGSMA